MKIKKILAAASTAVIALALAACTSSSFVYTTDDDEMHIKAENATETRTATIEIEHDEGLCINHMIQKGSFSVKVTDASGAVIFEKTITDNIADMIDVSGNLTIEAKAQNATGTLDIIGYDREAQAQADATLGDAFEQAGVDVPEELQQTAGK